MYPICPRSHQMFDFIGTFGSLGTQQIIWCISLYLILLATVIATGPRIHVERCHYNCHQRHHHHTFTESGISSRCLQLPSKCFTRLLHPTHQIAGLQPGPCAYPGSEPSHLSCMCPDLAWCYIHCGKHVPLWYSNGGSSRSQHLGERGHDGRAQAGTCMNSMLFVA